MKWDFLAFPSLSLDGVIHLSFSSWWGPILIFSLFNSYFVANAVAVKDTLDDIFAQLFIRFYQARGARLFETLQMIRINWFLPMLKVFCYFLPFVVAESILFEFLFQIPGLGKLLWYASDLDTQQKAVRVFTPKLMALTLVFSMIVHFANSTSVLLTRMMSR